MIRIACGLFAFALAISVAQAEVKVPSILSSHMVLQRELKTPIWGTAAAGEKVTVRFRDQTKEATADGAGNWRVELDPLKAGGPDVLSIQGANEIKLEDVLVGEVWIGSGQSNMAGTVKGYAKGDPELAKVLAAAPYPQVRLAKATGGWKEADAANCENFSALLLPFGVKLQQELNVPVGLMLGAVGGTPSGRWLNEDMFLADADCQTQLKAALAAYDPAQVKAAYEAAKAKWEVAAAEAKAAGKKAPNAPPAPMEPGKVRGPGFGDLYRAHIAPMAPFAIRGVLWDQGESQTQVGGVDQFAVMGALIKGWRKVWGQDFAFLTVQKPSGGGPAFRADDPITSKANKFAPYPDKMPAPLAAYPINHIRLMQHPGTFLVSASDLGDGIHPTNKWGYAMRSARVALGGVYGQKIEIYGPIYKSHTIEGDLVRIKFDHTTGGLASRPSDTLQGFAIAGADGVFHWADAAIEGDAVILKSAQVAKPVAVRYAWSTPAPWANLFNGEGLPAIPFSVGEK